jgi:DNA-directed RNA polymerase subunit M/transcription elongation factor TFIIS
MKILRKGQPWYKEIQCSQDRCQSLLLVEEGDIEIHWEEDPGPNDETHNFFFRCGACHAQNSVSYKDLPEHVRDAAYKKSKEQHDQEEAFKAAGE